MDKIDKELTADTTTGSAYLPPVKAALARGIKLLRHYYNLTNVSDVYRITTGKQDIVNYYLLAFNIIDSFTPLIQTWVLTKGRLAGRVN